MPIACSNKLGTVRQYEHSCQTSYNPFTIEPGFWQYLLCPLKSHLCSQIDLVQQRGSDDTGH